jgi:hypothetical protein
MKNLLWALFVVSVLAFLLGVISKFFGPGKEIMFAPVAWWRAAMGLAVYTLVLAKLTEKRT